MMRWVKMRLAKNKMTTPATVKMLAAMAMETFLWREAQTIRMTSAVVRAMQKPKTMPEMINLWPRRRLTCRMVMLVAAPATKKSRSTAQMGSSSFGVGMPPRAAVVGGYGGPVMAAPGACKRDETCW